MDKYNEMDLIKIDCNDIDYTIKVKHIVLKNQNETKIHKLALDTSKYSKSENFLRLSRKDKIFREVLNYLTNNGYYMTSFIDGVSIFEKYNSLEYLRIFKKDCQTCETKFELIYKLEEPPIKCQENFLLVIFSSFQINPYLPSSPFKRYFLQDFQTIKKYIPKNTYILRIADISGIAGGFYLNSNYDKNIEFNIVKLLTIIQKQHNIYKKDILLLGYSKGGTAALYYGIKNRYKALCIDPILTDEYHINAYNDSHFTVGIFPASKQTKFNNLINKNRLHKNLYVITSSKSQQFKYIEEFIIKYDIKKYLNIIKSNNPLINSHVEVGPNTKNITIMMINAIFYGINKKTSVNVVC